MKQFWNNFDEAILKSFYGINSKWKSSDLIFPGRSAPSLNGITSEDYTILKFDIERKIKKNGINFEDNNLG